MFRFRKYYFLSAIILFLMLVLIAMYVQDSFIRPYGGDFLVVIFLYCLLRSFFCILVKNAIFSVLLFSFLVEGLQYFDAVKLLGMEGNRIASVVLGNHFESLDMLLYALGALAVYVVEQVRGETHGKQQEKC